MKFNFDIINWAIYRNDNLRFGQKYQGKNGISRSILPEKLEIKIFVVKIEEPKINLGCFCVLDVSLSEWYL